MYLVRNCGVIKKIDSDRNIHTLKYTQRERVVVRSKKSNVQSHPQFGLNMRFKK